MQLSSLKTLSYQSISILCVYLLMVVTNANSNSSLSAFKPSFTQQMISGTLKQLYQASLSNNPAIHQAKAHYYSSLEQVKQAETVYYPRAIANVGLTYADPKKQNKNTAGITLTQTLFSPTISQIDHLQKSADLNKQAISIREQQLIVDLVKGWVNTLIAQASYNLSVIDIKTNKSLYDRTQKNFNIGAGRKVDVAEAEGSYRLALATQIQREAELLFTKQHFSNIVGLSVETIPAWNDNDQKINLSAWENFESRLTDNLNFKQSNNSLELAKLKTKAAQAKMYPTLQAQLTYQYSKFTQTNVETKPLTLQLSATWEFFSGGATQAEISHNQYLTNAAQAGLQQTYNTQRINALKLWTKLTSSKKKLPALEALLKAKKIAFEAYEKGYELGTETLLNVLTAQKNRQQAEFNVIQTKYSLWSTFIEFKSLLNQVSLEDLN